MTSVFAAKRRAEEFNLLVEDASTGGLRDPRYVEFLELVGALRETPRVEPRAAFVADLRGRLMAEAEVALAKVPTTAARNVNDRLTVAPRRTARERRFAVAIGGFAIVSATTSMAVAAQSALPGDLLYPLKRAIENAHTGFSVDDSSKGSTLLANASGRLDEVDALTRHGAKEDDAAAIADTLGTFSAQASEAADLLIADYQNTGHEGSISELRNFTASAMASLSNLESVVPDAARGALITAAQILGQIDTTAQSLCPACGGVGINIVPPFATQVADDVLNNVANLFTVDHPTAGTTKHPARPGKGQQGQPQIQEPGSVTDPGDSAVTDPADTANNNGKGDHQGGQQGDGPLGDLADALGGGHGDHHHGLPTEVPDLGPVDDVIGGVGDLLGGVLGTNPTP
jgi:hypothetical protein